MADIQEITLNEDEITYGDLTLADIRKQLDHLDTMLHDLDQAVRAIAADTSTMRAFIARHEPVLAKALKFLDNPVARYRAAMARKTDGGS